MQYIVLKIFELFLLNFIKYQRINYMVCEKKSVSNEKFSI